MLLHQKFQQAHSLELDQNQLDLKHITLNSNQNLYEWVLN